MEPSPTDVITFARMCRVLSNVAREHGLRPPGFKSPARPPMTRSIRRHPNGSATVAVTVRGRSRVEVAADLVAGVMAANPNADATVAAVLRDAVAEVAV